MMHRFSAPAVFALVGTLIGAHAAGAQVLRVGSFDGIPGQFSSIQAAVNVAKPGDRILIGPGDYKLTSTYKPQGGHGDDRAGAALLIQTPGLWLRGMNRNRVWLDGTKTGSPLCSSASGDQVFGPLDANGQPGGRNGILVYKAPNVVVENLSACNFLDGDMGAGNQIWWDAGQSTGTQSSLGDWWGNYLTATSTFFKDGSPSASYGIYSANTAPPGHGEFAYDYASNMNDSDFYVGACPDCEMTLDHVQAEDSPQGYSGTNAGGHVLIENSEWDRNTTGFATGDLNNDDAPSPQDGTCPGNGTNPYVTGIQRTHVCWTFVNNYVHDNNNPNVPVAGIAGFAVPGTGITIYGGRHDLFIHNRFVNNGGWGVIFVPFPDNEQPPDVAHCQGGTDLSTPSMPLCWFDDWGSEFADNTFTHNGFFGNPSNGDIAEYSQQGLNYNADSNCFYGNVDTGGTLTSAPANIDANNQCGRNYTANSNDPVFDAQIGCASGVLFSCPPGTIANYPSPTDVVLKLPPAQPTMPSPCAGVPADPWCSGGVTVMKACVARSFHVSLALAVRERFTSVIVITGGVARTYRRHGRTAVVLVRLNRRSVRVKFVEWIKVRGHREKITFTRIYHRC
jgi:hypothetical protein